MGRMTLNQRILLFLLLVILLHWDHGDATSSQLAKRTAIRINIGDDDSDHENVKLMVPTHGAEHQLQPKSLLKHVQKTWKAVVEKHPVGLQDPKVEAASQLSTTPLSPEEAWHHWSAAQEGVVDSGRFLVTFGVAASVQAGGTPLHSAAALGQVDHLEELLDDPELSMNDVDVKKELDGTTPLHSAVATGQTEAVRFLLKRGANVEAIGNNGVTPLMLASTLGHVDIVKILLEANADVNRQHTFAGTSSLHFAAEMGNVQVIKLLCQHGADGNIKKSTGGTALHSAADANQTEAARALVHHCDMDVHTLLVGDTTALYLAAQRGLTELCRVLISELGANPNFEMPHGQNIGHALQVDDESPENAEKRKRAQFYQQKNTEIGNGATALHAAAENGHHETARILLELGALQTASMQGATPLIIAMQYRHPKIAMMLLAHDSDPKINNKVPRDGSSALLVAVDMGYHVILDKLLERDDTDVNIDNGNGVTPLSQAIHRNQGSMVRKLLQAGAKVSASNPSALHVLAQSALQDKSAIEALIVQAKVERKLKLFDGDVHPFHNAATSGNKLMLQTLLRHFSDVTVDVRVRSTGATPLMMASKEAHLDVVKMLVEEFNAQIDLRANDRPLYGATALYLAAQNGHHEIVSYLLRKGANGNLGLMEFQTTPFFVACERGYDQVVKAFLHKAEKTLNINQRNQLGFTPLVAAMHGNHVKIMKRLVKHGADLTIELTNRFNERVNLFRYALSLGNQVEFEAVRFLMSKYQEISTDHMMEIVDVLRIQTSRSLKRPVDEAVFVLERVLSHAQPFELPMQTLFIICNVDEDEKREGVSTHSIRLLQALFQSEPWKSMSTDLLREHVLFADETTMFTSPLQTAVKKRKDQLIAFMLDEHLAMENRDLVWEMVHQKTSESPDSPLELAQSFRLSKILKILDKYHSKQRDEL